MITLNIRGARNKLQAMLRNIDRIDWSKIGDIGLRSIDKNFTAGGRYSQPGEELGGSTRWEKRRDDLPHPVLIKSGNMRRGIHMRQKQNGVVLISDEPYSAAQNFGFGGRNIPARPFMTIHPTEVKEMERELTRQLTRNI